MVLPGKCPPCAYVLPEAAGRPGAGGSCSFWGCAAKCSWPRFAGCNHPPLPQFLLPLLPTPIYMCSLTSPASVPRCFWGGVGGDECRGDPRWAASTSGSQQQEVACCDLGPEYLLHVFKQQYSFQLLVSIRSVCHKTVNDIFGPPQVQQPLPPGRYHGYWVVF